MELQRVCDERLETIERLDVIRQERLQLIERLDKTCQERLRLIELSNGSGWASKGYGRLVALKVLLRQGRRSSRGPAELPFVIN
jgi:hypothetical protein